MEQKLLTSQMPGCPCSVKYGSSCRPHINSTGPSELRHAFHLLARNVPFIAPVHDPLGQKEICIRCGICHRHASFVNCPKHPLGSDHTPFSRFQSVHLSSPLSGLLPSTAPAIIPLLTKAVNLTLCKFFRPVFFKGI